MRNDIVIDINTILGDKYKIYLDNNAGSYIDIEQNKTINSQMIEIEKYVVGIFRTSHGEIVALKDLFTTSFGYTIDFLVPQGTDIYNDLKTLRENLNGDLQDRTEYRYIMTFSEPFAVGSPEVLNGKQYQTINLSGNIAVTDNSIFGNEYKIYIDDIEVKGLMTASIGLNSQPDSRQTENKLLPLKKYISIDNTMSMMIHCRKDDPIFLYMLNYIEDVEQFEINNKETFAIKRTFNGIDRTWYCLLSSANIDISIGGYLIISLTFERTVVL